jgi:hypothetical protein
MALVLADRVRETSTTTGTGTFTLAGAVASYQSFSAVGNANTTYYTIVNQNANEWEVGIGTYTASGTTLSRDTVLSSSNAGAKVTFTAGTKDVWGDYPAGKAVTTDTLAYPPAIGGTTPAAGTFTPLSVYQATTATKATGLNQWNYSGKSISIAAQETSSAGLFFSDDGTKMFSVGSAADTVFQYNLGTAWDVTTATFTTGNSLVIGGQDTAAGDIYFKPDGLAFYLLGDTNNAVFQYTIGTAWTINTGAYASKSFSVATQETSPSGLWFRPDGSTMYVVGSASDNINQYSLGTAWDVTTATFVRSFSIAAQDGASGSLVFNSTGTSFYITGTNNDNVFQYNLGTAWDISTSVFVVEPFHVGTQENTPSGLFIDFAADNRAYVSGSSTDAVYQYNTATTSVSFVSDRFNWNGNYNVTGNSYFNGAVDISGSITAYNSLSVSGALTASSSISASSTITLNGSTTSTTSLGTSATTGTTTIGGTAQTGAITIGQSTAAQTVNVATGATATATTKTINIGTAGLSGSTTNINIGSAVSGAAGTITFSSGGTQMAVTNTASAVNYVQVTGNISGSRPSISSQGSDGNVGLTLSSKGNRSIAFNTNGNAGFEILTPTSSVNYYQVNGGITGQPPVLQSVGSDTNISQVFQPKGTGAIDLAAGSSGVNISNGGTVTAITGTATGTLYTSIPTVNITTPTTAGGVQAVITAQMQLLVATIAGGGTGYTAGDTLTLVGGTGTAATLTVSTVSSGVITAVALASGGTYSALPTNPISVTGGTGSGATFTATSYGVRTTAYTITNAGSGYVEQPTVSFSGGGGSGAAAYATVGSIPTVKSVGGGMSFATPSGEVFRVSDIGVTTSSWLEAQSGTTSARLFANAASGNVDFRLSSRGSGAINFFTNANQTEQLRVAHTASAVNYVQVTGSATGSATGLAVSAQGSDGSVNLNINPKGTAAVQFDSIKANYIAVKGAATGAAPAFSVVGTDTDIDLTLTAKGAGAIRFGTYTATVTAVAGYILIKDAGGTTRKLAVLT